MILIDLFRNIDGKISGLHVRGHSGTAPKGRDIVCAGVSALAQTALVGVSEHLHRDVEYEIDPSGDLRFMLRGEPDDLTSAILETVRLGFVGIYEANPNAVRIKEITEQSPRI